MPTRSRSQFTLGALLVLTLVCAIAALSIDKYGPEACMPFIAMVVLGLGLLMLGRWLVAGVRLTENDPTRPMKLETFNDNYQASLLVARLEEAGIKATAVGGFVSGFQAESPGYVDVVVAQSEFENAKSLFDSWQVEKADSD